MKETLTLLAASAALLLSSCVKQADFPIFSNSPNHLCFTAEADGLQMQLDTVGSPTTNTLEYYTEGGTWTDVTIGTAFPGSGLNIGQKVYVRAKTNRTAQQDNNNYIHFTGSADYEVSGNIMTWLIRKAAIHTQ